MEGIKINREVLLSEDEWFPYERKLKNVISSHNKLILDRGLGDGCSVVCQHLTHTCLSRIIKAQDGINAFRVSVRFSDGHTQISNSDYEDEIEDVVYAWMNSAHEVENWDISLFGNKEWSAKVSEQAPLLIAAERRCGNIIETSSEELNRHGKWTSDRLKHMLQTRYTASITEDEFLKEQISLSCCVEATDEMAKKFKENIRMVSKIAGVSKYQAEGFMLFHMTQNDLCRPF